MTIKGYSQPDCLVSYPLIGEVLCHCRDAFGLFYAPSQLGHMTLFVESYLSAEMHLLYSTVPANRATGHSLGSLTVCRDAFGLFYAPSPLGHRTLFGVSYLSAEMHLVYSTALASWATRHSLGCRTCLQRCIWFILQPQPTGTQDTLWGILPVFRDAFGLFYAPSPLSHRTLFGVSYLSAEMHLVYSTAPASWATRHSLGCRTCLQRCIWFILQPQPTGTQDTLWGILPVFRDAFGLFYAPSPLSHRTLFGVSYLSAEMHLVYSTAPVSWATRHSLGCRTCLQRCIWFILQPQPTGTQDTLWGILPVFREAFGLFYSPSRLGQTGISLIVHSKKTWSTQNPR